MGDILLTGAGGQLGRAILALATDRGTRVRGLTRRSLDITDRSAVLEAVRTLRPSAVVNAAAYTAVDRAESDRETAFAVNRDGASHFADACSTADIPLIHISSDYVFDGTKPIPYTENDPPAPISIYGESKLAGEEAVRGRCRHHVILRTSWLYSTHGHNFLRTILRLANEQDRLRVVADQFGCPTAAGDLAGAVLTISARLLEMPHDERLHGTFHSAGAGVTSWHGFAARIVALGLPADVRKPAVDEIATADYPRPARRPANSALDCGRLTRAYGITLRHWEVALRETLHAGVDEAAVAPEARRQ